MIYLVKTFTPRTFYSHLFIYQASGSDYVVCHMSHNRYIILDNLESHATQIRWNRDKKINKITIFLKNPTTSQYETWKSNENRIKWDKNTIEMK